MKLLFSPFPTAAIVLRGAPEAKVQAFYLALQTPAQVHFLCHRNGRSITGGTGFSEPQSLLSGLSSFLQPFEARGAARSTLLSPLLLFLPPRFNF